MRASLFLGRELGGVCWTLALLALVGGSVPAAALLGTAGLVVTGADLAWRAPPPFSALLETWPAGLWALLITAGGEWPALGRELAGGLGLGLALVGATYGLDRVVRHLETDLGQSARADNYALECLLALIVDLGLPGAVAVLLGVGVLFLAGHGPLAQAIWVALLVAGSALGVAVSPVLALRTRWALRAQAGFIGGVLLAAGWLTEPGLPRAGAAAGLAVATAAGLTSIARTAWDRRQRARERWRWAPTPVPQRRFQLRWRTWGFRAQPPWPYAVCERGTQGGSEWLVVEAEVPAETVERAWAVVASYSHPGWGAVWGQEVEAP